MGHRQESVVYQPLFVLERMLFQLRNLNNAGGEWARARGLRIIPRRREPPFSLHKYHSLLGSCRHPNYTDSIDAAHLEWMQGK